MELQGTATSGTDEQTLYRVIKLVSSPLELAPMLQGVVELATEATHCHACFIYLLDGDTLTIRAASPVFAAAVDNVSFPVDEGLTGWVARNRRSQFIRERLLDDPRTKYVPQLQEERFQSMVAVPILSREGDTIGVIVLHTEAPREFPDGILNLLEHIASLVSGAIENAQNYARERHRSEVLSRLARLAQDASAAGDEAALARTVTAGAHQLLAAELSSLYRVEEDGAAVSLIARTPVDADAAVARTPAGLLLDTRLLTVPLVAGEEHMGMLCVRPPEGHEFGHEERELARAVAHLAAVALKRVELIEGLTKTNIVRDLFEALAAGAGDFAAAKAAAVRCDLNRPYLLVSAEPAGKVEASASQWRAAAEEIGRGLARLAPRAAIEAGPGPVRALLPLEIRSQERLEAVLRGCRELGASHAAVLGVASQRDRPEAAVTAFRESRDAAKIARVLLADGGAVAYSELGAYRYLVQIEPEQAPHDRMREAVDTLIEYDRRRRTQLLDTLEQYLTERLSVIESARQLYIHPNTLRQRLGRIEELTGLELESDDLLSLELAIKLARLHGRSDAGPAAGAP